MLPADEKSAPPMAAKRKDYFFIVGYPRSGTTLLSVLLDRHSRLCVTSETAFFDEIAPALRPSDNSLLLEVLSNWRRLPELGLEPEMVRQRLGKSNWTAGDVFAALLDLYALRRRKLRCGEKTPQHLLHVPTIRHLFPEAKIICLLRDGREAALSLQGMPWGWGLPAAAELWQQYVQLMEQFVSQYPSHFMVVRYEDLLRSTEKVLSRTMEFLSECFEPGQLDTNIPSQVVLPRSVQWKGKALEPIDIHQARRRCLEAKQEELAFLERVLDRDLRRCGYA